MTHHICTTRQESRQRFKACRTGISSKEVLMSGWFDGVTRTLANDTLPRRKVIRGIAGTIAGVTLASWLPGTAFAQSKNKHTCRPASTCDGFPPNCGSNPNCYCFRRIGSGKGVCGCNASCSSLSSCSRQSDCAKGYACINQTGCSCSQGICIQRCTKTCSNALNSAGRTAVQV